ncbi:hypothetical protein AVEN_180847-1 [Araneus ventricosus]|uniref:PiggyBac transposable element-derived protein domain-containing protein n=1 Tax=Araneus ventricosus TaxID=182803 RepID=A0A4Y2HAP0_ARAVE|nr:hypothetical protein AVEN_180847-1 [Araneus ventricosus]
MRLPRNAAISRNVSTPLESWKLLMSVEMVKDLVSCTNIYIASISYRFSRERDAKSTTEAEMKVFIGPLYICVVHKSSHVNITDLWTTDGTGIEIFRTFFFYSDACVLMTFVISRAEKILTN